MEKLTHCDSSTTNSVDLTESSDENFLLTRGRTTQIRELDGENCLFWDYPMIPTEIGHYALIEGIIYYTSIGNGAEYDAVGVIFRSGFDISRTKAESENRIRDFACPLSRTTVNECTRKFQEWYTVVGVCRSQKGKHSCARPILVAELTSGNRINDGFLKKQPYTKLRVAEYLVAYRKLLCVEHFELNSKGYRRKNKYRIEYVFTHPYF